MSAQEAPQYFTECCGAAWDDFCKPWCVNARQDMCRDCGQAHTEPGGCAAEPCDHLAMWSHAYAFGPCLNPYDIPPMA